MFVCDSVVSVVNGFCVTKLTSWPQTVCVCVCVCVAVVYQYLIYYVHASDVYVPLLQVTHWPADDYGKFFSGDSYILLNTYNEADSDVSVCKWSGCSGIEDYCDVVGMFVCVRAGAAV